MDSRLLYVEVFVQNTLGVTIVAQQKALIQLQFGLLCEQRNLT